LFGDRLLGQLVSLLRLYNFFSTISFST
jgi:hypothetical protein